MTQEDKQLLLKDLCARLPYGLICQTNKGKGTLISVECSFGEDIVYVDFGYQQAEEFDLNEDDEVKPYLRPMSSMTEEEEDELNSARMGNYGEDVDWLNAHHFDYRIDPSTSKTLIESGLALEALPGMYKTE